MTRGTLVSRNWQPALLALLALAAAWLTECLTWWLDAVQFWPCVETALETLTTLRTIHESPPPRLRHA